MEVDEARVTMILELRARARAQGDYERADALREMLRELGVERIFDEERVYRTRARPPKMRLGRPHMRAQPPPPPLSRTLLLGDAGALLVYNLGLSATRN